jgi:hypothetical protein
MACGTGPTLSSRRRLVALVINCRAGLCSGATRLAGSTGPGKSIVDDMAKLGARAGAVGCVARSELLTIICVLST